MTNAQQIFTRFFAEFHISCPFFNAEILRFLLKQANPNVKHETKEFLPIQFFQKQRIHAITTWPSNREQQTIEK
jgi:hypothetical protein